MKMPSKTSVLVGVYKLLDTQQSFAGRRIFYVYSEKCLACGAVSPIDAKMFDPEPCKAETGMAGFQSHPPAQRWEKYKDGYLCRACVLKLEPDGCSFPAEDIGQ